jgi:hypothetical protein
MSTPREALELLRGGGESAQGTEQRSGEGEDESADARASQGYRSRSESDSQRFVRFQKLLHAQESEPSSPQPHPPQSPEPPPVAPAPPELEPELEPEPVDGGLLLRTSTPDLIAALAAKGMARVNERLASSPWLIVQSSDGGSTPPPVEGAPPPSEPEPEPHTTRPFEKSQSGRSFANAISGSLNPSNEWERLSGGG